MEKYNIIVELGRGAFGIVRKAQNKETKEIVAIKQMIQEYETWEECINLRELKSLRKLSHVNIIKLKEVFRVKKQLSFVFEYVEKNIYKLYETAKTDGATSLSDQMIKTIVYQIASALAYMHKHGFFHRDLKPENLLISPDNVVKLIDFGLAREVRSRPPFTDYVSTRWYRAPEILLRSTNYNSPVDIFALGCIMAELYLMKPLFNGSSEIDQLTKITSVLGTPSKADWPDGFILASQKYFTFPSYPPMGFSQVIPNCPPEGLSLISEMIKWDPQKRITAQKILTHPFFNGVELPEEIQAEQTNNNNILPAASNAQGTHSINTGASNIGNQTGSNTNLNSLKEHKEDNNIDSVFGAIGSQGSSAYSAYPNTNSLNSNFPGQQQQQQLQQSHLRISSNMNTNPSGQFSSNYQFNAVRQQSPPSIDSGPAPFNKSAFHGHYQSSSPDQRYTQHQSQQQNQWQSSEMNGMKGFEMSKGSQSSQSAAFLASSSMVNKKSLDPIYEFLNNDVMSINPTGNLSSVQQPQQYQQPQEKRYDRQTQQQKSKIDDTLEGIEQEIMGTYLPSVSRVRSNVNGSNIPSNTNNSIFGETNNNGNSGSIFSSNLQQLPPSTLPRNRGIKEPSQNIDQGYIPSAIGRSNQTQKIGDEFKYEITKPAPLFSSSNQGSIFSKPNNDIYNFDSLISSNIHSRKI